MLKTQIYSPDTCTCRVVEAWDDALPPDQVVFTFISIEHRGPEHASILDNSLYSIVKEENVRKNRTLALCASQAPATFSNLQVIAWAFDPGRTLQVSFPSISVPNAVKQAIQSACNTYLGLGMVVIS